MPMQYKQQEGYITVYLTLMFAIILSLLLSLVEGAAIGAARLQAELVADLGMDSVFAEYHRELFQQYGMLFIDDSYGTSKGRLSKIEKHLTDYMSYNLNPKKGLSQAPGSNWIHLEQIYLEIEEAAFATDDDCDVWKAQAIDYVKSKYGLDIIQGIQEQLQTIEKEQLLSNDVSQSLAEYRKEFEQTLETEEIKETDQETEDGFSYDMLMDFIDSFIGKGILYLVVPEQGALSDRAIERQEYISYRVQQRNYNQGSGLPDYVEPPDGIVNELLFQEFLLEKYGSYVKEKPDSHLKYQIEYILYGRDNDISNVREFAERLFYLRWAANSLYLTAVDTTKVKEVKLVATAICSLLGIPQLAEVLTSIIVVLWSMAESIYDVRCLFEDGKVPLMKKRGEWKLSLSGIFSGELWNNDKKMTQTSGISYEGYLRLFLAVMPDQKEKVLRSMDIVEMDIRKTPGNEYFRMDQCVDYLKVTFGFKGDRGQEYVFTRTMRYE